MGLAVLVRYLITVQLYEKDSYQRRMLRAQIFVVKLNTVDPFEITSPLRDQNSPKGMVTILLEERFLALGVLFALGPFLSFCLLFVPGAELLIPPDRD